MLCSYAEGARAEYHYRSLETEECDARFCKGRGHFRITLPHGTRKPSSLASSMTHLDGMPRSVCKNYA